MTYATLQAQTMDLIFHPIGGGISDEEFNTAALALYDYQRKNNAPYRQFCEFQGQPQELSDWRDIPAVSTNAFRHAALRTFSESETAATFRTSGTTGEGYGSHHFHSLRLYDASILRAWETLKIPHFPQILLSQRPSDAPHSSLCHMLGTLDAFGSQTWCVNADGKLDLARFREAVGSEPVVVLGTALAFLNLFEQLGPVPLTLPPGSLAMETGGYKGTGRTLTKPELYQQFSRSLGLQSDAIFNEYSMTELSSQWYTRGMHRPHYGPAWTRALVIDPERGGEVAEGGTGVLRLFDLANIGSVLALQTQDLAIRRGSGFELLGRDPAAIPRGCSRSADEMMQRSAPLLQASH